MSKWTESEIQTAARILAEYLLHEPMQNIYRRISIETKRGFSAIATRHHRWGNTFNQLNPRYVWAARKARGAQGGKKINPNVRRPRALHQFTFVTPGGRPSAETIAERERAFSSGHRDYTAEFCGDPLIGRSALDMKQSG